MFQSRKAGLGVVEKSVLMAVSRREKSSEDLSITRNGRSRSTVQRHNPQFRLGGVFLEDAPTSPMLESREISWE